MNLSRRHFLRSSAGVAAGFASLRFLAGCDDSPSLSLHVPDPRRVFDLPEGFRYSVLSRTGDLMDDGLLVPGAHDGMAAFPGSDGLTLLVRNHEMSAADKHAGAFGPKNELLPRISRNFLYDYGRGRMPCLGGTTTLVFDTRAQRLERHFLSLAGTVRNCAGGPTPWNSWVSCEETVQLADDTYEQDHGYNFEVPARADIGLAVPYPIRAMGRFNHEAIAVDPRTGIVYQTEDRDDGLIYRYIPNVRGQLQSGGRLEALKIRDRASCDTRNWRDESLVAQGSVLDVEWVPLRDIQSPDDQLRYQGFYAAGAARFARGEGMWWGHGSVYFACTTGGHAKKGQIWRYRPSPREGTSDEAQQPGRLELFVEPNNHNVVENADNLTVAPWGDLFVAEDGGQSRGGTSPDNYLLRITPTGQVSRFGRNALNKSELCGPVFSPDGSTLFVNIQNPGLTLAITGPWHNIKPLAGR